MSEEKRKLTRFEPADDRLLVKREESEGKSEGGIIIPDVAKAKEYIGRIRAAGPASKYKDLLADPDARILFGKYAGTEMNLNHEDVIIIRDADVLGVLRP